MASTGLFDRTGIHYATVWVDDLAAVVERWRANGGTIVMEPFDLRPGVRCSLTADPDGNTIELMQEDH